MLDRELEESSVHSRLRLTLLGLSTDVATSSQSLIAPPVYLALATAVEGAMSLNKVGQWKMEITRLYEKCEGGSALKNLNGDELSMLQSFLSSDYNKLQDLKESFERHEQHEASAKEGELKEKLAALDAALEKERSSADEIAARIDSLRDRVALDECALEKELKRQVWEVERDHELEELARLRIIASKVSERHAVVDGVLQRRALEIEAIEEEVACRNRSDQAILEEILNRTDVMKQEVLGNQEHYDAATRQDLAASLLQSVEDANDREPLHAHRLVDQIEVIRSKRRKEEKTLRDRQLQELNDARVEIEMKEKELRAQMEKHKFLTNKGIDFLAEVEFGNAPPLEYVIGNAEGVIERRDSTDDDEVEHFEPLDTLVDMVEQAVKAHGSVRKRMKEEMASIDQQRSWCQSVLARYADQEPYDGSLDESSYPTELRPTVRLVRGVLLEFVEEFLGSPLLDYERQKREAIKQHAKWEHTRELLHVREMEKLERVVIYENCTEILDRVVTSLIIGVYEEIQNANAFASKKTERLVLAALLQGSKDNKHTANLVQMFHEIQRQRQSRHMSLASKKKSRIPPTYHSSSFSISTKPQDMSELYINDGIISRYIHTESKTDDFFKVNPKATLTPGALAKGIIQPHSGDLSSTSTHAKRPSIVQNHRDGNFRILTRGQSDAHHEGSDDEDDFVEVLSFRQAPVHEPYHLSKAQLKKESDFWQDLRFHVTSMVYEPKIYGRITAMAGAPNGAFLAVGTNKQCLQVWDLRFSPKPLLIRRWMSHGAAHKGRAGIVSIEWSFDRGSRLVCLTEDAKVLLFRTNPSTKPNGEQVCPDLGKFRPIEMELLLTLTWKDFYRTEAEPPEEETTKKKKKRKKPDIKMTARVAEEELRPVHVSFFCSHSFMGIPLSLLIGLKNGKLVKWNAHYDAKNGERQVFAPCHAVIEPTNAITGTGAGIARKPQQYFGSTILREFFHAHTKTVMFAAFAKRMSEVLFTVDEKMWMCQWTYEPKAFNSFGWYLPSRKYKLDFSMLSFAVDEDYTPEEVFPPEDYSVGAHPELNDEYLQLVQDQLQDLRMQQLNQVPWSSQFLPEEGHRLYIYAPEEVSSSYSAPHQLLLYSESNLLLKRTIKWFKPKVVAGELLQIELAPDGKDIVFMVRYPRPDDPNEVLLRFYLFSTVNMEMEPVSVGFAMPKDTPAVFRLCPVLQRVNCDNVYLLVDNVVYVISLASGGVVKEIRPNEDVKDHVNFNMMWVANDHKHIVVGSETQSELIVYAIDSLLGT